MMMMLPIVTNAASRVIARLTIPSARADLAACWSNCGQALHHWSVTTTKQTSRSLAHERAVALCLGRILLAVQNVAGAGKKSAYELAVTLPRAAGKGRKTRIRRNREQGTKIAPSWMIEELAARAAGWFVTGQMRGRLLGAELN